MNGFFNERFVGRRSFVRRTLAGAASLSVLNLLAGEKAKEANPFAYDVGKYLATDPKLVAYQQRHSFSAPHPGSRGLAIDAGGNVFIAAGKFVSQHKPDGALISEIMLAEDAKCVAVNAESIFVGLRDHVEIFDRKGQRTATWAIAGEKAYMTGLAVGENDVFVADAGQRVILRYDRSGKLLKRLGERNKERGIPGFVVPSPFFAVQIAKDGLLRVSNPGRHRVEIYTREGDFEGAWGKPGAAIENFCGCCNPINLTLLPDDRVVSLEKGIPRVKVHGADGAFESVVAGSESFVENAKLCGPNDCTVGGLAGAVDAQGRIYILDFVANNVRVMERKGAKS